MGAIIPFQFEAHAVRTQVDDLALPSQTRHHSVVTPWRNMA